MSKHLARGQAEWLGIGRFPWFIWLSLGGLSLSTLVFLVFSMLNQFSASDGEVLWLDGDHLSLERQINTELKKLNVQQPLARQVARIQQVADTAVRSGGWIESYSLQGEADEVFDVILPSWVSQDYLDSLGRDVVTELRDLEGGLQVRKSIARARRAE